MFAVPVHDHDTDKKGTIVAKTETKTETKTEAKAEKAEPKRRQRSYEERIAELQQKQRAAVAKRSERVRKQLDAAREQRAAAQERLNNIDARIAELEKELPDEQPTGEPATDATETEGDNAKN